MALFKAYTNDQLGSGFEELLGGDGPDCDTSLCAGLVHRKASFWLVEDKEGVRELGNKQKGIKPRSKQKKRPKPTRTASISNISSSV